MDIVSEEKCFCERADVELRWYLVLCEREDQEIVINCQLEPSGRMGVKEPDRHG